MTEEQKDKMFWAWAYCDDLDKSTEFMFSLMADMVEVNYEEAVEFVLETSYEERLD